MEEFALDSPSIDLSHVARVCEEEWTAFLADNEVDPIPKRQDQRAFLINWVAVFIPEAFPHSYETPNYLLREMSTWFSQHMNTHDPLLAFLKLPLIGAALFAATESSYYLQCQVENFDYGGSLTRSFLHRSLGLVAPQMWFGEDLMQRLDFGMKVPFFLMETALVLYAVSREDSGTKMSNFKKWNDSFMNTGERRVADQFLKGESVNNPLESWLFENTNYVMLRLACCTTVAPRILPLGLPLGVIWKRVSKHPLFSPKVTLT